MSDRIDKILELLDNPTQHTTEDAPGDHGYLLEMLAQSTREAVEGMRPLIDALSAVGVSMADFLAAARRRERRPVPYKRNKHFGYGR